MSTIDLDYSLCVTNKINTNQHETHKYKDFYKILIDEYKNNGLFKKGKIFFEYFNAKTFQVKPRFDIDQKLYFVYNKINGNQIAVSTNMKETEALGDVVDDTLENALNCLYVLFPNTVEEDYAISRDCRWSKDKDNKDFYKISYHICYWKKKTDSITLKKYIEQNMDIFKESKLDESLDLKIYMSGMTKWRIPYCKKYDDESSSDNSLLEPINYKELKDFHKHLVTYVCNCEEFKLDIEEQKDISKNYNKDANDFINQMEDNTNEINSKKNQFTFIGVPKIDNEYEYTDIRENICGQNHKNNHNFLIHDIRKNVLTIRCHSDKCEDFSKILHRPKLNYTEFNIVYFNNIPITDGKENNYDECRVYFELFFKFMRDSNSYYRIDNTYDRRLKYYERKIKSIKIEGYGDLLYKERKENSIINVKFLEKYKNDNHKSAYFDLCFEPYNKNIEKKSVNDSNFNLFNGFNYESIITYEQREKIPPQKHIDFEILKNHILKYHCSNEPKHFDFLMQFLANIIQTPQYIPQIILVFYSSKHGCHAYNTPILMYDGNIKMVQNVKVNDILMGDDSTPRKVRVLARGRQKMCRIIPKKGETFEVNFHHKLCLKYYPCCVDKRYNRLRYLDKNFKLKSKTFEKMIDLYKFKNDIENHIFIIKVNEYEKLDYNIQEKLHIYRNEVKFQEKDVFEPYIIGLWLGDGTSANTQYTTQDAVIIKYLKENLGKHDLYLHHYPCKEYGYKINGIKWRYNKFLDVLKKHNLLNNKHIPLDYKCNSRQNQLKLLAGLLDSDGHFDKNGKCYEIVQKRENLIDDIIYLCRSLGFSAYKKIKVINCVNYYIVHIIGDKINEIPVLIKRKQIPDNLIRKIDNKLVKFTTEILEENDYYGFNLDGNHLFIQGDFIVSSNTGKSNFTRFISEVIGNPLSFFGSLKQITETHTNAHLGKLLNIIEEVDNYSTRQYENIIKDYSQRLIAALNQKNKDIIQIKTFIRYIFTSNHFNGVFFDSEDRRYCVYTFDKISDKKYVDKIQSILKDNYIKYLFGKYLENYKITYHNPNDWNQNRTKTSDYYNMMVEDSLKNFLKEIYANETYYLMEEDHDDFHIDENDHKYILIHHKKFSDLYKEFCKDANEKPQKMTNINKQLTSTYKSIFTIKKSGKGSRKFHRINLFRLGEYLNFKEIENKYNGFKKVICEDEIDINEDEIDINEDEIDINEDEIDINEDEI